MKNRTVPDRAALAAILLVALSLRLHNVGFGLPSLYDPDEPLFIIKAVELLTDQTLNPRWFGHPGTTTIYLTAIVTVAVAGWGWLAGTWASVDEFARAAYADPGLLFLPARVAMVLIAVLCVWLTFQIGRRLQDSSTGLIAAALLAINSLHLAWSQIVRTDIMASLFMLGSLYFAIGIIQRGARRDYIWAGILAGIGVATKWPAASVFIAIVGATIARAQRDGDWRAASRSLAIATVAALAALVASSPYLLLDWRTVMIDLTGEARPMHLGHTGGGFLGNLASYLEYQVAGSMGWAGLLFGAAGLAVLAVRSKAARWTLLPAFAAFMAVICTQALIWSRWILPAMPMIMIFAAFGILWVAEQLAKRLRVTASWRTAFGLALFSAAAVPSVVSTFGQIREREQDTRAIAAKWAIEHFPPRSSVALEHLELAIRNEPWTILFPVGAAGCIDGLQALRTGVRYDNVNRSRQGSPIVNLGSVPAERLDSCRADFFILTYFDQYRAEAADFPIENDTYRRLLAGGRTLFVVRPQPRHIGGPTVRIVGMPRR